MTAKAQNRRTAVFLCVLLLAGIITATGRLMPNAGDGLFSCTQTVLFAGLLLYWLEAVRVRLVPSRARTYVVWAGALMLLFMLLRCFNYMFAVTAESKRLMVYAYWLPQTLIPPLFLMTCIRIRRGDAQNGGANELLFLIPGLLLSLLAMSNDAHSLVYVPQIPLSVFTVQSGTYRYGAGFYMMYGWIVPVLTAGLFLLYREAGRLSKKVVLLLTGDLILWAGMLLLNVLVLYRYPLLRLFNTPETNTFGLLGVFEICIRSRLIPCNENYEGFFKKLQQPSVITDRVFQPAYRSEIPLCAEPASLRAAIDGTVSLTPDLMLSGTKIRAGYAFWTVDESALHRTQEQLQEANEMIEQENDLTRAETEQKEQAAYLASRHRIYYEIAEELYPCQKKIARILDGMDPDAADYSSVLRWVCVLNAYVKRKANLHLLAAENDRLPLRELFLALRESAGYLTLAGLAATAREPAEATLPSYTVLALYDAFEALAEQLVGQASSLMISWNGSGLRLSAKTERVPDTAGLFLPVRLQRDEGVLYMDIPAGEEVGLP